MKTVNSNDLFNYALQFCKDSIAKDRGSDFPTFREVAKKFRVRMAAIQEAIEDFENDRNRYMDTIVGVRCGAGIGSFKNMGDYKVEAWDERIQFD